MTDRNDGFLPAGLLDFVLPTAKSLLGQNQSIGTLMRPGGSYRPSDRGDAERIVDRFGNRIKWSRDERRWYYWNGRFWQPDTQDMTRLQAFARRIADDLWAEVACAEADQERRELRARAKSFDTFRRQKSVFSIVQSLSGMSVDSRDFDADPWLLNCENGTVDLRTGELRPHAPADLITKMVPAIHDPQADCPRWIEALTTTFQGKSEWVHYFQKILGYSVCGTAEEKAFFLLYGPGGDNAKSFIQNFVRDLLGDYAQTYSPSVLLCSVVQPDKPRSDIYSLRGVRLGVAEETDANREINEAALKQFTGGPGTRITARAPHGQLAIYPNQTTMFLSTNNALIMQPTKSVRRRIYVIPFNVRFLHPDDYQRAAARGEINIKPADENLKSALIEERSGILNWMVQGCLRWQSEGGLDAPHFVEEARRAYFEEVDPVSRSITEACVLGPHHRVACGELHQAYKRWCLAEDETPVSRRKLTAAMLDKGMSKTEERSTGGLYYLQGISLASHAPVP